jgi:protein phosphatase 4 regulatory subunit 3
MFVIISLLTDTTVAIRFFRQLVVLNEEFYIKHLAEKNILGPVLDVLLRTMPRDNLLCSACLDLFVLINKENISDLIKHLVDSYREKMQALAYMDTFREMLNRYDQTQGYTVPVDPYYLESEDEMGRRPSNLGGRGMVEHLAVDQTPEEYWNTSDEEEENAVRASPHGTVTNGGAFKPLVEYTSDEETDENGDAVMDPSSAALSPEESLTSNLPNNTTGPPERLSEKRRREEDDDDALDKLVTHKRRSSSSSAGSTASNLSAAALRKKKGLSGSRDLSPNGTGPKRISISISSTVKTSPSLAVKASGDEEAK